MTEAATVNLIVAVVAALPPTFVAWLAWRQGKANAEKAVETGKKVDEVHVLANDNLAKVSSALAVANEKIVGLEKMVVALGKKRVQSHRKSLTKPAA
jgi:L-cysteine desulfidase